jgi:hypothetical protein
LAASSSQAQKTDESDEVETADTVTMDNFSARLPAESLHYLQRRVPAEKISRLKKEDAFWYADKDFASKKKNSAQEKPVSTYIPLGKRSWFQVLLWVVIIGGFSAALTWFLTGTNALLLTRKKKRRIHAGEGQPEVEDIFSISYPAAIDKAVKAGNYRLATRLSYLRILKELAGKNIIRYQQDKTNLDYLRQLQATAYHKKFLRITRHYEFTWYGLFDIDSETYGMIKKDFEQFENMLQLH